MKSIREVSEALATQKRQLRLTQLEHREQAGIASRTTQQVLSGTHDFKLSTLLAVADRVGLELLLVPKDAARGCDPKDHFEMLAACGLDLPGNVYAARLA